MNRTIFSKIIGKFDQYHRKASRVINIYRVKLHGIQCDASIIISGKIFIRNDGEVRIGTNVKINSGAWTNPIGGNDRTYFQIMRGGVLQIGNTCGISNTAFTVAKRITVGDNVLIGAGCKIYDTDFHPLNPSERYGDEADYRKTNTKEVIIEDGAFIGGHSIILKGSHIGKNSIVGAGSVVSGVIPDNEIWAGNPARFIKKVML